MSGTKPAPSAAAVLTSLGSYFGWPGTGKQPSSIIALTATGRPVMTAAGHYDAFILRARENRVISHVGFMPNSASGSPTADVRIETVDASGVPTGTLWATNTNIVTGTLVATTWGLYALTASASITKGQVYCVRISYNSGTSFTLACLNNTDAPAAFASPYNHQSAGSPAKALLQRTLCMAIGSSSTSFYFVHDRILPIQSYATNAFNNTNGARRGLRFKIPFKSRCIGLRHWNNASTGDFNVAIYSDAGAELSSSSTAIDGDQMNNSASGLHDLFFDTAVDLLPDTWYRAVLEPSSATNISQGVFTLPSLNYRSAFPGGLNHHYTTFASAAWDDTATAQVPILDVLLDALAA